MLALVFLGLVAAPAVSAGEPPRIVFTGSEDGIHMRVRSTDLAGASPIRLSHDAEPAIEIADRLGSPLLRWQTRAALAGSVPAERDALLADAASIIHEVAGSLAPERAAAYLAAPQVAEVLDASG